MSGTETPPQTIEAQPTPVGMPTGEPVTATIGPEGGTLVSEDGVLTLVVPAGAVTEPTEFGIQPITNESFGGIGGAYRLTPDGATFAQPVELRFTYTDAEIEGIASSALGVAFQTAEGFWEWQGARTVDPTRHEITLPTDHFTDYSRVPGYRIRADRLQLELNGSTTVRVQGCLAGDAYNLASNGFMVPCFNLEGEIYGPIATENIDVMSWSVNGTPGGGTESGLILDKDATKATYQAPGAVPAANPVAVSVNNKQGEILVVNIQIGTATWTGFGEVTIEYVGTAPNTSSLTTTRANVTWTYDPTMGYFIPEGTVTYTENGSYDSKPTPCTVTAEYEGPVGAMSSLQFVDDDTYGGAGATIVTIPRTDSCSGTTMFPMVLNWWPSQMADLEPDGTIQETCPPPGTPMAGGCVSMPMMDYEQTVNVEFVSGM
jgi:hypothetical protein